MCNITTEISISTCEIIIVIHTPHHHNPQSKPKWTQNHNIQNFSHEKNAFQSVNSHGQRIDPYERRVSLFHSLNSIL